MKDKCFENVEKMQNSLQNMDTLSSEELDKLSYLMLGEAAAEYRHSRKDFFTAEKTKNKVIEYITKYCNNTYVLRNLLGLMGFTATRFDDYDSRYYEFLMANTNSSDNGVKRMISRFLPDFPQFETFENKWKYLLSIPFMPPKKDTIKTFYIEVKSRMGNIPEIYKNDVVKIFENYMLKNDLHVSTKAKYEEIINKLKSSKNASA